MLTRAAGIEFLTGAKAANNPKECVVKLDMYGTCKSIKKVLAIRRRN
jgi:hypothetical protein